MKKFTPKTCKTVRLVYGTVFSVFTAVVAALCVWQVLDIYLSGHRAGNTSPFTYELVSERVSTILAVPLWIWIAGIVVGFILWEIFPVKEKLVPYKEPRYVLQRLKKRMPAQVEGDLKASYDFVKREEKILKILWIVCAAAIVCVFIPYVIVYLALPSSFPNLDKTGEMLRAAKYILPLAAAVYAMCIAYVIYERHSEKRQLPHVKELTKGVKAPVAIQQNKILALLNHKYFILSVRIAVACFGVAFVIAGCAVNDFASVKEVFNKAIRICTECIGLG